MFSCFPKTLAEVAVSGMITRSKTSLRPGSYESAQLSDDTDPVALVNDTKKPARRRGRAKLHVSTKLSSGAAQGPERPEPCPSVAEGPAESNRGSQSLGQLVRQMSSQLHISAKSHQTRFVIAHDYGTTFSATAWVKDSNHELDNSDLERYLDAIKPEIIDAFPNTSSRGEFSCNENEVPTISSYTQGQDATETYEWGYSVMKAQMLAAFRQNTQDTEVLERIKMLLYNSDYMAREHHGLVTTLKKNGRTEVRLIADYLKHLHMHACKQIKQVVGHSSFDNAAKTIVLSVPAAFTPAARRKMFHAAFLAGLPEPIIVSEPEAAALAVLREKIARGNLDLQKGDTILIVDAGGGTVDLGLYTIEQKSPLMVSGGTGDTGDLCGSTCINDAFREWFLSKLNSHSGRYRDEEIASLLEQGIKQFEQGKRDFGRSNSEQELILKIHGLKRSDDHIFQPGLLMLSEGLLRSFFDPTVKGRIIPLIEKQIATSDRRVKYILMVGGFSASEYLQKSVIAHFNHISGDRSPGYPIEVLHAKELHETLVVQGSILRSFYKNFMKSRPIESSYGVLWDERYIPGRHGVHPELRRDPHEGYDIVPDCIHWLMKAKGNIVKPVQSFPGIEMHWTIDADFDFRNPSWEEFFIEIYVSDDPQPKDHQTIQQMARDHIHCEKFARIQADFSNADMSRLRKMPPQGEGKSYYEIPYQFKLDVIGDSAIWDLAFPDFKEVKTRVTSLTSENAANGHTNIAAAFRPGE